VSAERAAATAQRLEARAKARAHMLEARAHDQRGAAEAVHAGVVAAYQDVRAQRCLSSFVCAVFEDFSQECAARAATFEAVALQTLAAAEHARGERRHWGALAHGLRRRARRAIEVRSCRG
jgi:hypothetical protein